MEIRQLTTEEFDSFAKNYPYKNFYQTAEYGTLMDRHAFNDYYLGLIDDSNNLVAATLILVNRVVIGYKWGYCPRGYLIDYKNEEQLVAYLKYENVFFTLLIASLSKGSSNTDFKYSFMICFF